MKRFFFPLVVLIPLSLFLSLSSCKKEDNPLESSGTPTSGKIETAPPVDISTTPISSAGGTIKVSKPGTPVDGLEILIPANSYTTTKNFKISYSEIKGHQLGSNFNPISPMISVTYEGGYSKDGMSVKIPIHLPAGHYAMGFLFDSNTGKLEGMPVESLDNNSITVSTRSFTTASAQLNKKSGINDVTSTGNMIISSISETVLNAQTIISSGFTPGVDDWEFVNYGSYISPGGHCAGQSLTAMWYYYEKRLKGATPLFHLYDKVNNKTNPGLLWQDNPSGYRFASTIQEDFGWDGWVTQMKLRSLFPSLVWKAFAVSMLVTGEPQSVLINNSKGLGGHAMIVYKINFAQGKLYIADPNFPNNYDPATKAESIRTIDFVNGKFNSYFTGLTAGANSTEMDQISYFGKTAYIDWGQIGKRWTEFENKTIGSDRFPKYNLYIKTGSASTVLLEGATVSKDSLFLFCRSTDIPGFLTGTDRLQDFYLYDSTGTYLATADAKGIAMVKLKSGRNRLGFYLCGAKNNKSDNYVDFQWITVNYVPALIITTTETNQAPITVDGVKNKQYTFVAKANGFAPKNGKAKYEWNFGDGTATSTITNDSTLAHTFLLEGNFSVKCILYNDATKITEGTVIAKVSPSCPATITYSGKTYNTVTIGNQCWMKENLNVGNMIQGSQDAANNSVIEKYCYDNNPANCSTYGGLYQWDEAMQYSKTQKVQGICPAGWHIPSNNEFSTLQTSSGNDGNALKAVGQGGGTNTTGFSGLIAGLRGNSSPYFSLLGNNAYIWSSSSAGPLANAGCFILGGPNNFVSVYSTGLSTNQGFSVRCLKD